MSTPAARSAAALRQRRYRRRLAAGKVALSIVVEENELAGALLALGKLTPQQALDRRQVERVVSAMVSEWAAAWRGK